jgi:hypothetical protein
MDVNLLINDMVSELKKVRGVVAIVLGGSRARETHTPVSDIDLGLYYDPQQPLDLQALDRVATHFDDTHRPAILTTPGEWGPWINGGGWLRVSQTPVDFLYRDLQKVRNVVDACHQGIVEMFYQPGHPHGFLSSMYMGEISVCKILWENGNREISALKEKTAPYPQALKHAVIAKFAWEIDFSLANAHKSLARSDIVYASGCCFRAASCLLQTMFAVNEQYWLNEKGAVALLETLPIHPPKLKNRIESAFSELSSNPKAIQSAIERLSSLSIDTARLVENIS